MTCAQGGAREHLQYQRWQLPVPQFAAGLLALQHLDAGLAWAMCGFAEQLEFLDTLPDRHPVLEVLEKAARATCDFYIENTPPDGIPYWDTGAPGLAQLGDWRAQAADPFNAYEPVDSSAAAIAAQGCCG